jgi:hypothetical protein
MNDKACDRDKYWWRGLEAQGRNNICEICCAQYKECGGWTVKFKAEVERFDAPPGIEAKEENY